MYIPNAINGATLKAEFPPNPMSKSSLVIRTQERKSITENQGHSHKRKQKQKETNGIKQCFHFEIVMANCVQVLFDFSLQLQVLIKRANRTCGIDPKTTISVSNSFKGLQKDCWRMHWSGCIDNR